MQEDQTRNTIGDLPNEILLAIFSYLSSHDIKYIIAKVCVRWSELAKDTRLWKHIHFKTSNRAKKIFGVGSWYATLKFLENTPELRNVEVSHGHSDDEIVQILQSLNVHCRHLSHIEFDADVDVGALIKHFRAMENLLDSVQSLKLNLTSYSQGNVFKILPIFKHLRKVTLTGSNPENFSFKIFLRDCLHLEHLNVSGVHHFSKSNFMSLWRYKTKFLGLGVKTDKLDGDCLRLLSAFPNLKDLTLVDGNSSAIKLDRISRLECLRRLHLQEDASSPVLTSSTLANFFQKGIFPRLTELKLYKSRLNDDGVAEIRRNCHNLMYLEVMTYPRCPSGLSKTALLHVLHCKRLQHFEILFDKSEEADWIYRRIRHVNHECDIDGTCPVGLEGLLVLWDEIQIPVD